MTDVTCSTPFLVSCSQTTITDQPARRRARDVRASLFRLPSNFDFQKCLLDLGIRKWEGQACQKHPCTNTATRLRKITKSGEPGRSRQFLPGRSRSLLNAALTAISGRRPSPRILDICSDLSTTLVWQILSDKPR